VVERGLGGGNNSLRLDRWNLADPWSPGGMRSRWDCQGRSTDPGHRSLKSCNRDRWRATLVSENGKSGLRCELRTDDSDDERSKGAPE
jgi:hypothetical protein